LSGSVSGQVGSTWNFGCYAATPAAPESSATPVSAASSVGLFTRAPPDVFCPRFCPRVGVAADAWLNRVARRRQPPNESGAAAAYPIFLRFKEGLLE
jgi:hypothetical protein